MKNSKGTSTVHEVQQWHKHSVHYPRLFPLFFSTIPIRPFLIQIIFHSLVLYKVCNKREPRYTSKWKNSFNFKL